MQVLTWGPRQVDELTFAEFERFRTYVDAVIEQQGRPQ